ncbi:polysaccharide biosynthesis C-terminal domain-containing protein, partial [Escherichia coli]|nr:polysaccharide biosynthesis C-terminal domain-containing protein [Escherichia coli]
GCSLAVNVAACLWLVPRVGALGGALATTLSYLLAIAWGVWQFRTHAALRWRELLWPDWRHLGADLWPGRREAGPAAR